MRLPRRTGLGRRPGTRPATGPRAISQRPRRGPPDAEAPEGAALAREVDPHASRPCECTACQRSVPAEVGRPAQLSTAPPVIPSRGPLSLGNSVPREQATGVFRILICLILAAGPSAVPAPIAGPTTRSAQATPIDLIGRAGLGNTAQPSRRQFSWPLAGAPTVLRGFHPPTFPYGPGHRGIDLAAAAGEPVLAAGAGTVMFAGVVAGRGVVSLSHLGGLHTTYEPVSATVTVGQRVSRGEQIATVQSGHPGCPVMVCLHWGAFRGPDATEPGDAGRQYVNPLRLIRTPRVRLLPIEPVRPLATSESHVPDGALSRTRPPASCPGAGAPPWYAAGIPGIR